MPKCSQVKQKTQKTIPWGKYIEYRFNPPLGFSDFQDSFFKFPDFPKKKENSTKYCIVRFGNVINSSGSVIPLFRKQIAEGGPITITHKDVTRYFMTISEASSLVIQAGEFAEGGDVFILDMGNQIKILELAKRLIYLSGRNISHDGGGDGIEIHEIGLRPGEKLYEELLISGDKLTTSNDKIFKSIEKCPSKEVLIDILDQIYDASLTNNVLAIRNILKIHVEGFDDTNQDRQSAI